jgi:hypothetical protein
MQAPTSDWTWRKPEMGLDLAIFSGRPRGMETPAARLATGLGLNKPTVNLWRREITQLQTGREQTREERYTRNRRGYNSRDEGCTSSHASGIMGRRGRRSTGVKIEFVGRSEIC